MKKYKYFIYTTLIIGTLLYACSEEADRDNLSQQTLSKEAINEIGRLHNQYLSATFSNFDWGSKDRLSEAKNNLMSIEIPEISLETRAIVINSYFNTDFQRNQTNNDLEAVKAGLKSQLAISLVDRAFKNLYNYKTHTEFAKSLAKLKVVIEAKLEGKDFEIAYSYITVLEYSSYFWKPAEDGGSGEGYAILVKTQDNDPKKKGVSPCTKAIIAADAAAAATTTLGAGIAGWIAGAFNPAAFAAVVVVASTSASVIASQVHYACHDENGDGNPDDS